MEEQAKSMRKQIKVCTHHHISLESELACFLMSTAITADSASQL